MRAQKLEESQESKESALEPTAVIEKNNKKRKASEDEDRIRKRTKGASGSPAELSDTSETPAPEMRPIKPLKNTIQIPSRPATPLKSAETKPKTPAVDEDEWAAFEADIAAAEAPVANTYDEGVISAPAISAAELAAKDKEEENRRKREKQDAELEGDKEDAAKRMEDELEEIEGLEQRVKKLKEMREALRSKNKSGAVELQTAPPPAEGLPKDKAGAGDDEEDEEDDDEYDEDDFGGFMARA
jgi:zinc finger protein 830